MNRVDQVAQVSTESVEFPHQKCVALAERLQARRQLRPVILLAGCMVLIETVRLDASNQERVPLEIGALRPIGL